MRIHLHPLNAPELKQPVHDPALACLVIIARFHGVAADAAQLSHAAARDGEPFDNDALILGARSIGLKATQAPLRIDRLDRTPLPALAFDRDGRHFIIARCDGKTVFILEADAPAPTVVSFDALTVMMEVRAFVIVACFLVRLTFCIILDEKMVSRLFAARALVLKIACFAMIAIILAVCLTAMSIMVVAVALLDFYQASLLFFIAVFIRRTDAFF